MMLLSLWRCYSLPEWRQHPWRQAVAVLAVALGVALGLSVHLINQSAMGEFSAAMRGAQGQADVSLRATRGDLPEALLADVARQPGVAVASPVLVRRVAARAADGHDVTLALWGLDALSAAAVTPGWLPVVDHTGAQRAGLDLIDPDAVFVNAMAAQALGWPARADGRPVRWTHVGPEGPAQAMAGRATWRGEVSVGQEAIAVMDIAAVQDLTGAWGQLSRIDVRLQAGVDVTDWLRQVRWPAGVLAERPDDGGQRVSALSRAYRVNLTVLALVALFTGGFLVFSVQALSVARRLPQWALLGVLGLSAGERRRLVWLESAVLGMLGAVLGVALGTGLAALALRLLGGDLGGGYFTGVQPSLHWSATAALGYAALGLLAAMAGGWAPAATVARMPAAQALKGLGLVHTERESARAGQASVARGLGLFALAAGLSQCPPWQGVPWAAYGAVAALLLGGLALVPAALHGVLRAWPRTWLMRHAGPLLAVERARRMRHGAAVLMAGIVASLSLSVAITVMVASFRQSVIDWLEVMLPADVYVRAASLPADWPARAQALPGVQRARGAWIGNLSLDTARPPVSLIARAVDLHAPGLPLVGPILTAPAGHVPLFVSEAMVDLYGARPGTSLPLPLRVGQPALPGWVVGVWRDYARQTGAVVLDLADYRHATGDTSLTDLALWMQPEPTTTRGEALTRAEQAVQQWPDAPAGLQVARPAEIRAQTLRLFDRSFAVTLWLQAVAIGIGLFGTAASFSAQVLARRKEFGLLTHLGFTRREVLGIVATEGAALSSVGALVGLGLGLLISLVLVKVVNPQSFHWTMDISLPWPRLLALALTVVAAGTLTAWAAGRAAVSLSAVLAVKEES